MKAIVISTYPIYLPSDGEDKYEKISVNGAPIYKAQFGDYYLFVTECFDQQNILSGNKRGLFISKLDLLQPFISGLGLQSEDVFYIIHDLDILNSHFDGLYPVTSFTEKDELHDRFLDGHLYLFMHEDDLEMYESVVGLLPNNVTEDTLKGAIELFKPR